MQYNPAVLDEMLSAWNETDKTKIRAHLKAAVTPDVYFVDPTTELTGIRNFEKLIHDVQARFPGAIFSRTSNIDSHHHICRCHWEIHYNDELLVEGFDVAEMRDGKVARLLKFFGKLPTTANS